VDGGFREKRARAAPAREKVRAGSARASKRRSLFVQQAEASFLRNPTSAFLANKQVSCGIQQVSCGMRVALLILMAVKLLSRTGCKITARCSHGVNRRSGTRACCGSLPARARPIVSHTRTPHAHATPRPPPRGRALLEKVNPGGNHQTHQAEHSRPRPTRHMVPSKNLHAIAPSTHCQSASSVEASSQPESHRRVAESARRHGSEKPEHPRNIDQTDTLICSTRVYKRYFYKKCEQKGMAGFARRAEVRSVRARARLLGCPPG